MKNKKIHKTWTTFVHCPFQNRWSEMATSLCLHVLIAGELVLFAIVCCTAHKDLHLNHLHHRSHISQSCRRAGRQQLARAPSPRNGDVFCFFCKQHRSPSEHHNILALIAFSKLFLAPIDFPCFSLAATKPLHLDRVGQGVLFWDRVSPCSSVSFPDTQYLPSAWSQVATVS